MTKDTEALERIKYLCPPEGYAEEVVTRSGKAMAKFAVTTSDDKKNAEGKYDRGPAKWWNCICFDTNAQKALDILTGGSVGSTWRAG